MPAKIARSAPRPSLGPPELLVAIHTSRQSCSKAGKARIFALVWESSGESRPKARSTILPFGANSLNSIEHRWFLLMNDDRAPHRPRQCA